MNNMQSKIQRNVSRVLMTSVLTFAGVGSALAATATPAMSADPAAAEPILMAMHDGDRGERGGRGEGPRHGKSERRGGHHDSMRHMLRGLDLTEAQRDQIFELRHASVPAMRDAHKAVRAARKQLRDYSREGNVDKAQLQQYAGELGQAIANMTVLRIEGRSAVMAVLTPEQKAKMKERMEKRMEKGGKHGKDGHGKGGHRHGDGQAKDRG